MSQDIQYQRRGAPLPPKASFVEVPDYLVFAILVTLFCCIPLGIVAIVFAARANSLKAAGDIPGALDAAQKAKVWVWVAFALGLVAVVLSLLFGVGSFMAMLSGTLTEM